MKPLEGQNNQTYAGQIKTAAAVTWSRLRAWHGEDISLLVRTDLVKDGAKVELRVVAKESQKEIDKITGKSVSVLKYDHPYKLEWKGKPYGAEREFVIEATVGPSPEKQLKPTSGALVVDLDPPLFSA